MMDPLTITLSPAGHFVIHVPGMTQGHDLTFITDDDGIAALKRLLIKRQSPDTLQGIGTESAPTQSMIDDWIKANGVSRTNDPAINKLARGIDLSEYDL